MQINSLRKDVSCDGKPRYRNYTEAERAGKGPAKRLPSGHAVYRCEFCQQYHVGMHFERRVSQAAMAGRKERRRQRNAVLLKAWLEEQFDDMASGAPSSAAL